VPSPDADRDEVAGTPRSGCDHPGVAEPADDFAHRTRWSTALRTPLNAFLHAETSGAVVLLAAAVLAVLWATAAPASYADLWNSPLTVRLRSWSVSMSVRDWVNTGLMSFFFFVVGLEARREADIGEIRELRRIALPLLAGVAGMVVPILLFLSITHDTPAAHGWGAAMSTDTAFALGVLTIVGARSADRLRVFLLTVVVVDDIAALLVIAIVYTEHVAVGPLVVAVALFAVLLVVRLLRVRSGSVYALLGMGVWLAMLKSGVDPLIVGLAIGLLAYAYPAGREDLERAMQEFRQFREQPTPELARRARMSLQGAVSPNERLALLWHPWTSYLVVPLFALANAGVPLRGSVLGNAFSSRLTLAIVVAYVVGKPLGILTASLATTVSSRGRLRPPVGFGSVVGAGAASGVGFTVALLVATIAFDRVQLQQAKVGVLTAAVGATLLSWVTFRILDLLPPKLRTRALLGSSTAIVDLADPVDPRRDHIRGPEQSEVTLLEYGDLECPYCGRAEPVVRELLRNFTDITYVWRHLPLDDVHPHARLAAEATEAAAAQGRFWEMHDLLLTHQDALRFGDLVAYAGQLGLDVERFSAAVKERRYADRVAADVDSAALSGVTGTPTFFVNGRRHHGAFDLDSLKMAVEAAGARATLSR